MTQRDSAPHERVVVNPYAPAIAAMQRFVAAAGVPQSTTDDWPDDDGPVTATERWALAQIRAVPHGSVVVHKRDGEIKRVEKCWSEVAPEGR